MATASEMKIRLAELTELVGRALENAGASAAMAAATARALVTAESAGQGGHGLSRVAMYADHLRSAFGITGRQLDQLEKKGTIEIRPTDGFGDEVRLVGDYGKGVVTQALLDGIRERCKQAGCWISVSVGYPLWRLRNSRCNST